MDSQLRRRLWTRGGVAAVALAWMLTAPPAQASLDKSFGTGGIATVSGINSGKLEFPTSVVIQPGGKVLMAGGASPGPGKDDFGLARLNRDGTLDTSFGPDHNGKVHTSLGGT